MVLRFSFAGCQGNLQEEASEAALLQFCLQIVTVGLVNKNCLQSWRTRRKWSFPSLKSPSTITHYDDGLLMFFIPSHSKFLSVVKNGGRRDGNYHWIRLQKQASKAALLQFWTLRAHCAEGESCRKTHPTI